MTTYFAVFAKNGLIFVGNAYFNKVLRPHNSQKKIVISRDKMGQVHRKPVTPSPLHPSPKNCTNRSISKNFCTYSILELLKGKFFSKFSSNIDEFSLKLRNEVKTVPKLHNSRPPPPAQKNYHFMNYDRSSPEKTSQPLSFPPSPATIM